MSIWKQELERIEAAAIRVEDLERMAEGRFDEAHARAEAANDPGQARETPEFRDWMAARAATDAAWGQWAQWMDQKPANDQDAAAIH